MISKRLIAAIIAFLVAIPAFAQQQPASVTTPDGAGGKRPVRCADFQRGPGGTWIPRVPVNINGIGLGPGVGVSPGVGMGGIDLAAQLNQQCP